MTATFESLMARLCDDGEASVRHNEVGYKRIGALRGFEIARACESPEALVQAIIDQEKVQEETRQKCGEGKDESLLNRYWEERYCTLQLSYCWKVIEVGLGAPMISARAGMRYAEIVGVKEDHYDHGSEVE